MSEEEREKKGNGEAESGIYSDLLDQLSEVEKLRSAAEEKAERIEKEYKELLFNYQQR